MGSEPSPESQGLDTVNRPSWVLLVEAELTGDVTAPSRARKLVAQAAESFPGELRDRAALVASELVTNALRHGSGPGTAIRLVIGGEGQTLTLEVIDRGPPASVVSDGAGGFGLTIVEAAADRVGVERGAGWHVTAEFTAR